MTFDPKTIARPEILSMKAYKPFCNSTGEKLRLQSNENRFRAATLSRYPGSTAPKLTTKLANLYGVDEKTLLVTRGIDDAIDLLCRTFLTPFQDSILTLTLTTSSYERSATIQGAKTVKVPLSKALKADFDGAQALCQQNKSIKLVFISTPYNASGAGLETKRLRIFIKQNPDKLIIINETYVEFSSQLSFATTVAESPNLLVLRTLSKAWGLAGARIGCLIASAKIIDLTERVQPAYPLPTPSIQAALDILTPAGIARETQETLALITERNCLASALKKLGSVQKVFDSETNFLLVQFDNVDETLKTLDAAQIIARDFRADIDNTIRITVGTPDDNALILAALGGDYPITDERSAIIERTTNETSVLVSLNLGKSGPSVISTGIGFFDHMLEQVAKHSGIAISIQTVGDTEIDAHHTVEDTMLTLGEAFAQALGDKRGIGRYGFALPMDEVRAEVLIDLSGRAVCRINGTFDSPMLGDLPTEMIPHAFQSFASSLGAALHVNFDGDNDHHKAEGAFKALAKCLQQATKRDGQELPSTKGVL